MNDQNITGLPVFRYEALPPDRQRLSPREQGIEGPNLAVVYVRTLRRRKWTVLGCVALGTLLGLAATLGSPTTFRARTSFDVLGVNEDFMNIRAVDPTEQVGGDSVETLLQTEIKLLESETLMNRVVAKMKKAAPNAPAKVSSPADNLLRMVHINPPPPRSRNQELGDLAAHTRAKPIGMTRLIEVGCESPDKVLATQFCNTLADEFVSQDQEVRWEATKQTIAFLQDRLAEVRATLDASERKLQSFDIENQLLFSDDKESVAQSKLRMLGQDYSQAEADRTAREAQYKIGLSVNPDSLPVVLDDEPLKQYRIKLAELERQKAEVSTTFMPQSPQVEKIDAQIAVLRTSIEQERRNMIERLKNEFASASARENAVMKAYNDQERLVEGQIAKTAQLHMLEREAESARQIYASLLQKVKEAGFASALKSAPVRVVDRASLPVFPSGPRRLMTTGVGMVAGLFLGVVIAFFQVRTDTSFRLPGDARTTLAVREFGVIPRATASAIKSEATRSLGPIPPSALFRQQDSDDTGRPTLDLITWQRKRSLMAEAFRGAMSSILYSARGSAFKSILISSPSVGEGKTIVTSNLGIAFAEAGLRVVIVDADLRKPRIHTAFDVDKSVGLQHALRGEHDPETCPIELLAKETQIPNLYVLPSGTGSKDPALLLHSKNLGKLLQRLQKEFDLVLIDSPPMRHLPDARTIARLTAGMVMVLRMGVATRASALEAAVMLKEDGIPILGVILNDFNPDKEAIHNYYRDYYRYSGKVAT